jgi:hypothetical protein
MPNTYTLITSTTVGSGGTAAITLSSIPSTYTDLLVKISGRGLQTGVQTTYDLRFNGSSANWDSSNARIYGNGAAATSDSTSPPYLFATGTTATANVFSNDEIYIPNYTTATLYKPVVTYTAAETNATTQYLGTQAGNWQDTAAITSITLTGVINNFIQYTTVYLYGIANS